MADIKAKSFNFGGSDRYIIPQDFIINVTVNSEGSGYTADKTYSEILEAYNMGHTLYVETERLRLPFVAFIYNTFTFSITNTTYMITAGISKGGASVTRDNIEPVPRASTSDAGKVLMVGDDGDAVWTTIINAEEVAY